MYTDLEGKWAVVTGSGKRSGIGYAIAKKLAIHGSNIVIADLGSISTETAGVKTGTLDEMNDIIGELKSGYGIRAIAASLDVTDSESVTGLIEIIRNETEAIDILCNNAGASFGVPSTVLNYDEAAWMKTIDVNLHGVFRMTRAAAPMIKSGGSIINIASRAGKVPPLLNGAYAVAKAGVIMLTKVMARELAGSCIRVNAICPGQIATDLEKWRFGLEARICNTTVEEREKEMCKTIPLGRIGTSDEVANLAVFLASGESSYMTGQAINVTGGQLMEI